ncbi:Glycosyl hydrolases family 2 [Histomonas meleagridis]|uniref:Glycosyl hydrolases family 2 n=1 Tax=Histomonas meleagridis TaxID=135588 RepID=UPI003559D2E9|nr:Glycosyl hydrolases family 2 [Histomonas meleagridis]KAH0796138.1 Glycosyl hydrolases family 2 [Histomonas meleagridis]
MSILSFLETFNTIAKPVFVAVFLGLIGLSFIIDFTNFKSTGTKLAISLIAGVICLKLSVSLLHYVGVALLTLGIISLENQIRAMLSDYVPQSVTSSFITTFESLSILFPLFGSHFLIVSAFSILILSIVLPQYLRSKTQILMTPYAEKMSRDLPWNEYPRPQFKRDSFFNLNGKWNYKITSSNVIPENIDGEILVPFPLESILSGVGKSLSKTQFLYYKRTFILPNDFVKDKLLLHFGAVDCIATVFLNGKELITHVGGYIPFQIDITSSVNYNSENTLIVRVQDQLDHKYPYGKQRKDRGGMWYTPVSGIWQTVWVESVSNDYIESLKILPDIDRSQVTIQVNGTTSEKTITIYQDDKYQKSILSTTFTDNSTTINIPNAHLWSPEDPHLYYFTISTSTDTIKSYFAMRKFSIDKQQKRLCLNNKPYFFNGLLDQGYFSDGIFLPATSEGYKDDIIRMKELGFNTLRKHIKIEPLIFYYLCDIYGMVIFQDFVNNTDYSFIIDTALPTIGLKKLNDEKFRVPKVNKEIFIQTMNETVSLLYNSPCIGYWTIFNEGWGQFESSRVYHILQKLDSTRIIDSHSGWFNGGESDVESLHIYFKQLYDVESDLPLVLSEFGGYSYKIDENSFNTEHNYGYRLYNDQADFQKGFVNLYENEVMPLIKKGLCACIYTQVSDVEDETNGILTYDRKVCKLKKDEIVEMMKKLKIE